VTRLHRTLPAAAVATLALGCAAALDPAPRTVPSFLPGGRVLLDAHNCYPESGRWPDRIVRALGTGVPLAIEQDLAWIPPSHGRPGRSVVSHETTLSGDEPGLREHFFEHVRPIVERALRDGDRRSWPLITLNLDFKTDEREHHEAVEALLTEYESWLTTAERGPDVRIVRDLRVGPLLVLTGESAAQERVFHDAVPVGGAVKAFGAIALAAEERGARLAPGLSKEEQRDAFWRAVPDLTLPPATNYRRWWNNAWSIVEEGGQRQAREWSDADAERLRTLTSKAHRAGLWIRFYTLNGHDEGAALGWSRGYNFGSPEAVRLRWLAAVEAGVDFVATDQYEAFGTLVR
jgi:hypothetical protein